MSDEPEPFFSKDLHDHAVLALARVTWERDDAQIALKASKLVAEIAEEGMVRWKREAEAAKAEIARLKSDLSDLEEVHETLRAETKRADYWKAEAERARAALKTDTGEQP